ncbi:MAG TPA: hypothetical protein VJP76_02530, partial [Candidatus Tumulicola sp.]|nr:hypothetical protein [Candidatus Tumulicola sp.]
GGYDALMAGLAFLPSSLVVSFVASPLTIPIARAIGVRSMGFAAAALMVAGEVVLLFVQPHSSYWAIVFPATCIGGFGGMLCYQSGMVAALGHVDDADEGSASAMLSFALQLGIGFGVALGAAAQELRAGTLLREGSSAAAALDGGLHAAFWVCAALGLAALAATLGIRHVARAQIPQRHFVPFGRLHRRLPAA